MAKFGKKYRSLQINEWRSHYLDYKRLKQKIKSIKQKIDKDIINGTFFFDLEENGMPSLNVIPIESRRATLNVNDLTILYTRKYGKDLQEFVEILDEELNKYYSFYILLEQELYQKVNNHLYTQTNYQNYSLLDIYNEMNKLHKTAFLIKCLNSFSYDNLNAIKNILKKFDNKLGIYCGNIEYKYISYQLSIKEENKLKYLLQSKTVDEALSICESNLKELLKYYQNQNKLGIIIPIQNNETNNQNKQNDEINTNFIENNEQINKNNFLHQDLNQNNIRLKITEVKQEILNNLKESDDLTYFKIQYGDWFYFLDEDECPLKQREKFLENAIFNPILSSTFRKDNIISKFISNKKCLEEVEKLQTKISIKNKINIIYILIHTFFYNTLITCIYPLLFIYIKGKNYEHIYAFLTIAMTYLSSSFFMVVYHNTKLAYMKMISTISYIFLILGSLCYIFSFIYIDPKYNDYIVFSFILCSRILIGLGNNIMVGKKYITLYTPRFFVGKISLIYLIFQIIGLAFGPFIGIGLVFIPEKDLYWKLKYNCYNCIGYYGIIASFVLFLLNLILFTSPGKNNLTNFKYQYYSRSSNFNEDFDDTLDKEYYDMKKKLINNNMDNNTNTNTEDIRENSDENISDKIIIENNENEDGLNSKKRFSTKNYLAFKNKRITINSDKNLTGFRDIAGLDSGKKQKSENINKRTISESESDLNSKLSDINQNKEIKDNPLSITIQKEMEQNDENDLICTDFNKINMIPRTLDDIIRKEKTTFGYINHNLLILFLLLFFNNMIKENYIAFVSYYITITETFSEDDKNDSQENLDLNKVKITCLLTGVTYLSELVSLFFIFPFYKINVLFKKYAIILMTLTIILMFVLSFFIYIEINYPYFIILSFLILINMTLEVISSSYLTYLLPPGWKFKHIRAGALTVYIMAFGKICGILFCLISYSDSTLNYFGITVIVFIFYTGMIIYFCKSKNLRIKAICRIIQIKKLEELIL